MLRSLLVGLLLLTVGSSICVVGGCVGGSLPAGLEAITGTVRDETDGSGVVNARVIVEEVSLLSTSTDSSGVFLLTGVAVGVSTLTVEADGFVKERVELTVPPGGVNVVIDLTKTVPPLPPL